MKRMIFTLSLLLAGCQATAPNLVQTKLAVVTPPADMYVCPIEKKFPNWQTLNDVEVARTIVKLYKNNLTCKTSIDSIQRYLEKAKQQIEQ